MVSKAVAAGALLVCGLLALGGCTGSSQAAQTPPATASGGPAGGAPASAGAGHAQSAAPSRTPSPSADSMTQPVGLLGRYIPAERTVTLTEPAHAGPAGHVGRRTLVTTIWYPAVQQASTRFPLIMFGPGFQKCAGSYAPLLSAWASAGYVVAAVNFPYSNCHSGDQDEADLVNQPGDLSYALTALLGPGSGDIPVPVNPRQVAAAGQSDGGDAVTALAASGCCTDTRLAAVAVLSGQDSPYSPAATDFTGQGAPPMLFTQGTSDSWNAPASSFALFQADRSHAKYYLRLPGASHLSPYTQAGPALSAVVRVSVAFFGHYLLHLPGTLTAMQRAGHVPGVAQLISG